MRIPPELRCRDHALPLAPDTPELPQTGSLRCPAGCQVPVVKGIPRFIPSANYASAFGLQWNAFRQTQLDSFTGTTISRDRLTRCLGGSLEVVRGKRVLEAGCGAGRFTEILLAAGARVMALDLSAAVEANAANCAQWDDYFVCQADLRYAPVAPAAFDIVLCLGVIQHTPNTEETIAALAGYVQPGGMLVIDHYSRDYPYTLPRKLLRPWLLHLPSPLASRLAATIAKCWLPLHQAAWKPGAAAARLRGLLRRISPLVDYYQAYPQLKPELLAQWAVLDTHDTLTDFYKHLRGVQEIHDDLAACGLTDITLAPGGNGVEARARKPLVTEGGV